MKPFNFHQIFNVTFDIFFVHRIDLYDREKRSRQCLELVSSQLHKSTKMKIILQYHETYDFIFDSVGSGASRN